MSVQLPGQLANGLVSQLSPNLPGSARPSGILVTVTVTSTPLDREQGRNDDGGGNLEVARYFADAPNRLVGFLIDAVILSALSFVAAIGISVLFGPIVTIDRSADSAVSVDQGLAMVNAVLGTAIGGLYFVVTWRRFRGSPGQRLLRMEIHSLANGSLTIKQGIVRWAFLGLPLGVEALLTTSLSGIGDAVAMLALLAWYVVLLASIAQNAMKQGIHDRVAGTIVTKAALAVSFGTNSQQETGVR
jgi:uncharacterized RDD family membrane protein YckC